MKKIMILIALLITFSTGSFAQYNGYTMLNVLPSGVIKAKDTTVNTDTSYLYFSTTSPTASVLSITPISYNNDIVFQWANTQISGTSGGTVIFQGSMSGTFTNAAGDWNTLISDKNFALIKDTVTVSGTTVGTFICPSCKWRAVRARYIASGTQTSIMTGTAWVRPRS